MPIWIGGYSDWTAACDAILTDHGIKPRWTDPTGEPEPAIGLLSGSSADWYPFLDRVLRRSRTILLGNPGSWSLHDLMALERISDESGARVIPFRPWRELLSGSSTRQVRIHVGLSAEERWKPAFGHAVDLLVQQLGTDHLLRTDASRSPDMKAVGAQLLAQLRFQNGALAQLALERRPQSAITLATGLHSSVTTAPDMPTAMESVITALLEEQAGLPTLQQAIAGRKIEEKIMAILRSS
ncbi:MAG: hypothetical protein OXT73_05185 [Bacteroidota bacterium]|nr:hypothetical protein [Bacteroidota bacterium]